MTAGRADGAGDPTDRGGAVYINQGSPTFVGCVFSNNYAGNRGAGVRVAAGSPSFTNCTFQGNFSESAGAGLSAASVGSLQVRSCIFRSNTVNNSTGGGGIEATDNTTVVNSVVAQNSPNGMNFLGGNNAFINSTVANNASYGIALFANPNSIANSIIYGNPNGAIFLGISGIATVSYSDIQGGSSGTGNIDSNPFFVNAPADLRLGPSSPAADAGNNAAVPGGVTTDVAGLPRFFEDTGAPNVGVGTPPLVDMGAHERVPLSVSPPSGKTVCAGSSVSFAVTASGSPPFSYRWRKGGIDLSDGGPISGSATATLTINPAATGDSGTYDAVVTDGVGQSVNSATAALTVNALPPSPVATNSGPVCTAEPLQFFASTVPNAAYVWTGPGSFVSIEQNPTIGFAHESDSGTYSVTANVAGCFSPPGTTNAVVHPSPFVQITAPSSVCPNSAGNLASVPDAGPGSTYTWSITNGAITAGAGTRTIVFSAGSSGSVSFFVTVESGAGCPAATSTSVTILATCPSSFYTVTPCRVADTRDSDGPHGGPALSTGIERTFVVADRCGIPSTAKAVSLNVTVTQPTAPGHLTLYPGGSPAPTVSAINFRAGQTRANNAIVPLGVGGALAVQSAAPTHFIIDVNGYFE